MKPTLDQLASWPSEGKALLAQYDAETVVVYQAYRPYIGKYAAEHKQFGDGFRFDRMTWIKPGFLWMMHRSEWATAAEQECVLALWLRRDAFDSILAQAVISSFEPSMYPSLSDWKRESAESDVRVQWDPDWDSRDIKVKRRVIQLGLGGEALRKFATEWLVEVKDITEYVREQARYRRDAELLLTPAEKIYPVSDPEVARRIGLGPEPPKG